jgi:hypothetical protein
MNQIFSEGNYHTYSLGTPMQVWFCAIYLFVTTRHSVSGRELERTLGVTYKTVSEGIYFPLEPPRDAERDVRRSDRGCVASFLIAASSFLRSAGVAALFLSDEFIQPSDFDCLR